MAIVWMFLVSTPLAQENISPGHAQGPLPIIKPAAFCIRTAPHPETGVNKL